MVMKNQYLNGLEGKLYRNTESFLKIADQVLFEVSRELKQPAPDYEDVKAKEDAKEAMFNDFQQIFSQITLQKVSEPKSLAEILMGNVGPCPSTEELMIDARRDLAEDYEGLRERAPSLEDLMMPEGYSSRHNSMDSSGEVNQFSDYE